MVETQRFILALPEKLFAPLVRLAAGFEAVALPRRTLTELFGATPRVRALPLELGHRQHVRVGVHKSVGQ